MISELHIENIAVIKKLTVDFKKGFSVLTGETGAGKSIIIDSVNLLLGARSARELIRNGESTALVCACFTDISDEVLAELALFDVFPDEDGTLYVQRTLSVDGKSSAKINGRAVPFSLLRDIGKLLINIHGQHDSAQLLVTEKHLGYLDRWAETQELLAEYSTCYNEMVRIRREIKELTQSEQDKAILAESLSARISEIENAKLKEGEEEHLLSRLERLTNIEKIARHCSEISSSLSFGGEGAISAIELVKAAKLSLEKLGAAFPDAQKAIERLDACMLELKDIADTASELVDPDISDPEIELDKTQSRLDTIARLKRKYGETVSDVLKYKDEAKNQLAEINGSEARIKELKSELAAMVKKATECAGRLTRKRTECAKELSDKITEQLQYLDLEKAEFFVSVTPLESENGVKRFSAQGCDSVEFLISTNPGEPCKSLSKVASGGELSRVMLALKTVLADSDRVSTLIFDEIDTGVSGKTSQKIGIKLLEIGKSTQVFSITHSAQIAAMGDTHYKISKKEVDGRNETSVTELDGEDRVDELSRIMGGINITENLKNTSREMLRNATAYRI